MKSKVVDTPKLRFPGFIGTWEEQRLGNVADFLDERRIPLKEADRSKRKGPYPYYGASGIIDYVDDFIFDDELILLGEDGENILSRALPLAFRVSGKCWVNNHAHVIKPKEKTCIDFLCQYLENLSYVEYNTGTAQPKLNQEICKRIPLRLPALPEQQEIAGFLSQIDKKVRQLARKKDLLLKYKKGVMRQLFDQKCRFKDNNGDDFPEWETKRLGDICQINPPSAGLPELFFYIDLDSVESGKLNKETVLRRDDAPSRAQRILNKGDILFQMVRPYQRNNLIFDRDGSFVASTGYAQIRPRIDTNFLFQSLLTDSFVGNVVRRCTGTSYPAINSEDLAEINIAVPSHNEQKKMGDFLHGLDKKIDFVIQEIERVRMFKKGLSQQMFV